MAPRQLAPAGVITLDTSAIYAIIRLDDSHHARMVAGRYAERPPFYVPAGILAGVAYLLERTLPQAGLTDFLRDIERGAYTLDCGERDFPRIRELVTKYGSLPLGFADSAAVACAERRGGRVLTADERDFTVVARGEKSIEVVSPPD